MTEPTYDRTGEDPYPLEDTAAGTTPGTDLATITPAYIEQLLAPHTVSPAVWLRGLLSDDDFPEQDAEAMTIGILAAIIGATTPEETLNVMNVARARDLCGGDPGGRSPVLQITAARPLKSDYAEGAACYVIVKAVRKDTGENIQFTTGARAVQMAILKFVYEGWLPFEACLEIRREKTRNGYYPLNLVSGI